jgi:hypothetical protein
MLLSLQDAADRLGKTRRQLRYMIQTQRIQAVKTAGRWMIEADDLPLSGPQRQAVDRRERQLQAAVERGLGLDEGSRRRRWSVRDLKAVQVALPLYRHCAAGLGTDHPASTALGECLQALTRGCHRFERADKAAAYRAARDAASSAVFHLLLADTDPGIEPAAPDHPAALITAIEQDLMAALAGLLRRLERNR